MPDILQFENYPAAVNGLMFLVAAGCIWWAGTRLSLLADAIADRTGLGQGIVGALLLGGATSLPEIATTVTASVLGNPVLAVNNLLGGVAMQLAVLALIDVWLVRGALTFFSPKPVILLGGVLLIAQLALAMAAVFSGELYSIAGMGLWPVLLMGSYVASLYFMQRYEGSERWLPADIPDELQSEDETSAEPGTKVSGSLSLKFAAVSLVVLAGGWLVANTSDALTAQLGLGSGFVGATFVALTTSLPEISTTAGAVRIGAYTLAFSNIFGTNSLEVALLFFADIAYGEGPIVDAADRSAGFIGAIGILMTTVYLWGLLERRNKTVLRMGVDSLIVTLIYAAGLIVMYTINGQ